MSSVVQSRRGCHVFWGSSCMFKLMRKHNQNSGEHSSRTGTDAGGRPGNSGDRCIKGYSALGCMYSTTTVQQYQQQTYSNI
jgi:hypothetical protein